MPNAAFRQYVTMKASPRARAKSADDLKTVLLGILTQLRVRSDLVAPDGFTVTGTPSEDWTPLIEGWSGPDALRPAPEEIVVPCEFAVDDNFNEFRSAVEPVLGQTIAGEVITSIGADPGGSIADHYCPSHDGPAFATRRDARRLLKIDPLPPSFEEAARGRPKVNVIILDQGLDKDTVPETNYGGGWGYKINSPTEKRLPGTAKARSHGMMLARNILDIAPSAVLYDLPVIPPERIDNIGLFAHQAQAAYEAFMHTVGVLRQFEKWRGPWIAVNAWGITDRRSEHPRGDYTEDTNLSGHPLNKAVGRAVASRMDVVFAAGNCGQFSLSPRCWERGPGSSIWGANSHPSVITVGAVAAMEKWIGYSAQGPGQQRLTRQKPDFCAPSQFRDTNDAALLNTGTSAACALAAGVLALLRSRWDTNVVSPTDMRTTLISSSRPIAVEDPTHRMGSGILDFREAFGRLPTNV